MRQGTQGMLAGEYLSSQTNLPCEYISTQGMFAREARKHSRHVDMSTKFDRAGEMDLKVEG